MSTSEMSTASTISLSLYPCIIKSVLFKALDSMCLYINYDYRLHVVREVKILWAIGLELDANIVLIYFYSNKTAENCPNVI